MSLVVEGKLVDYADSDSATETSSFMSKSNPEEQKASPNTLPTESELAKQLLNAQNLLCSCCSKVFHTLQAVEEHEIAMAENISANAFQSEEDNEKELVTVCEPPEAVNVVDNIGTFTTLEPTTTNEDKDDGCIEGPSHGTSDGDCMRLPATASPSLVKNVVTGSVEEANDGAFSQKYNVTIRNDFTIRVPKCLICYECLRGFMRHSDLENHACRDNSPALEDLSQDTPAQLSRDHPDLSGYLSPDQSKTQTNVGKNMDSGEDEAGPPALPKAKANAHSEPSSLKAKSEKRKTGSTGKQKPEGLNSKTNTKSLQKATQSSGTLTMKISTRLPGHVTNSSLEEVAVSNQDNNNNTKKSTGIANQRHDKKVKGQSGPPKSENESKPVGMETEPVADTSENPAMATVDRLTCSYCEKDCRSASTLARHEATCPANFSQGVADKRQCYQCLKIIDGEKQFLDHVKQFHKARGLPEVASSVAKRVVPEARVFGGLRMVPVEATAGVAEQASAGPPIDRKRKPMPTSILYERESDGGPSGKKAKVTLAGKSREPKVKEPVRCKYCEFSHVNNLLVTQHERKCSGKHRVNTSLADSGPVGSFFAHCQMCGIIGCSRNCLRRMNRSKPAASTQGLTCFSCLEVFPNKQLLGDHLERCHRSTKSETSPVAGAGNADLNQDDAQRIFMNGPSQNQSVSGGYPVYVPAGQFAGTARGQGMSFPAYAPRSSRHQGNLTHIPVQPYIVAQLPPFQPPPHLCGFGYQLNSIVPESHECFDCGECFETIQEIRAHQMGHERERQKATVEQTENIGSSEKSCSTTLSDERREQYRKQYNLQPIAVVLPKLTFDPNT